MTKRLFEENVYMKEAKAKVLDVNEKGIVLDRTIFFPEGGGQSRDEGFVDDFPLQDLIEEEDIIYHVLPASCGILEGSTVTLTLNWDHRFDNMQRHCGEHILSGAFHHLFGGLNKGFHMGEEYMTIDIKLPSDGDFDKVTWEMAKEAELSANQVIWSDAPVKTSYFKKREDALSMPLRKELAFNEDISIVTIGDLENPADCVACCGTHPSTAGQVGLIKIYKVEKNKDMYRIYFEAGRRAFTAYEERFDVLTALENSLSAGFDDILDKYKAQQEKTKSLRNDLYQVKKFLLEKERKSIEESMTKDFTVHFYDALSVDDLLTLGRSVKDVQSILFLAHRPSKTLLLFSKGEGKFDCGKLVKENASIYDGKGGGNKVSARAIFKKEEYIELFAELLEKHLR